MPHTKVTNQAGKVVTILNRCLYCARERALVTVSATALHPVSPVLGNEGLDGRYINHLASFHHPKIGCGELPVTARAIGAGQMVSDNIGDSRHFQGMTRVAGLSSRFTFASTAGFRVSMFGQVL